MSKQLNNYRNLYSFCENTLNSNKDRFPRASVGSFQNRKDISELLSDRMSILNLATKVEQPTIKEPTCTKQSPITIPIEETFITPREIEDLEADKENLAAFDNQETITKRTPIAASGKGKLIEFDSITRKVCPFTLQMEDENEPSTVKNIVHNLQKWSVSPFEGFTERCMEEEFISPRQFEEASSNLHFENMTLLNKNKELMQENKQIRKEYEERIRTLEEELAYTKQELSNILKRKTLNNY